MANKNELKRLAVLDLVNKLKNSGQKEIKANTFDLFFASSRKWLIEFGMETKGKGAMLPIIIKNNNDYELVAEYFGEKLDNEEVVEKLLENYLFLIRKYNLKKFEKVVENLNYKDKIQAINLLFKEFNKLEINFPEQDLKLISKFNMIYIPYYFKLEKFDVESTLKNYDIDFYSPEYLNSEIKFYFDLMFNCYNTIEVLNIKIDSKGISELRKYFTKNLNEFKRLNLADSSSKIYNIIQEYANNNSLERINFSDVENILLSFDKYLSEAEVK